MPSSDILANREVTYPEPVTWRPLRMLLLLRVLDRGEVAHTHLSLMSHDSLTAAEDGSKRNGSNARPLASSVRERCRSGTSVSPNDFPRACHSVGTGSFESLNLSTCGCVRASRLSTECQLHRYGASATVVLSSFGGDDTTNPYIVVSLGYFLGTKGYGWRSRDASRDATNWLDSIQFTTLPLHHRSMLGTSDQNNRVECTDGKVRNDSMKKLFCTCKPIENEENALHVVQSLLRPQ